MLCRQRVVQQPKDKLDVDNLLVHPTFIAMLTERCHVVLKPTFVSGLDHCNTKIMLTQSSSMLFPHKIIFIFQNWSLQALPWRRRRPKRKGWRSQAQPKKGRRRTPGPELEEEWEGQARPTGKVTAMFDPKEKERDARSRPKGEEGKAAQKGKDGEG